MSHLFLHVAQQAAGWTYNIFHRQFGYGVVNFDQAFGQSSHEAVPISFGLTKVRVVH
jgi:hypothetical protein